MPASRHAAENDAHRGRPATSWRRYRFSRGAGTRGIKHCVIIRICIVWFPAGGLSLTGEGWRSCPRFLLPVNVLARLFRHLFLDGLEHAYAKGNLSFPITSNVTSSIQLQEIIYQKLLFADASIICVYVYTDTVRGWASAFIPRNHHVNIINMGEVRHGENGFRFIPQTVMSKFSLRILLQQQY
jgi:hypothetical protein